MVRIILMFVYRKLWCEVKEFGLKKVDIFINIEIFFLKMKIFFSKGIIVKILVRLF